MAFLRYYRRGNSITCALVENRRIKRGKDKGKVVQDVLEHIGNLEQLSKWISKRIDAVIWDDLTVEHVEQYGDIFALSKIIEVLEFDKIMFPYVKNSSYIDLLKVCIINRNISPVSKLQMQDWASNTAICGLLKIPLENIYAQSIYRAMDRLKVDKFNDILKDFLDLLVKKFKVDITRLLFDGTHAISYGKKCTLLAYGYNAKGTKKRQLSIIVGATQGTNFPFFVKIEDGKYKEKNSLPKIVNKVKNDYNAETSLIIVDNGFITKENLKSTAKENIAILSRLSHTSVISKKVLSHVKEDYSEVELFNGSKRELSSMVSWADIKNDLDKKQFEEFEPIFKKFNFCAYESILTEDGHAVFKKKIERAEKNLKKFQEECNNAKRGKKEKTVWKKVTKFTEGLDDYIKYDIKNEKEGYTFTFEVLWDKFTENEIFRKYVVLTSNMKNPSNIGMMNGYTQHYEIEDVMRTLKSVLKLEPLRHWVRAQQEIFITVLSLMVSSMLNFILRAKKMNYTSQNALKKLNTVKKVHFNNKKSKFTENGGKEFLDDLMGVKLSV